MRFEIKQGYEWGEDIKDVFKKFCVEHTDSEDPFDFVVKLKNLKIDYIKKTYNVYNLQNFFYFIALKEIQEKDKKINLKIELSDITTEEELNSFVKMLSDSYKIYDDRIKKISAKNTQIAQTYTDIKTSNSQIYCYYSPNCSTVADYIDLYKILPRHYYNNKTFYINDTDLKFFYNKNIVLISDEKTDVSSLRYCFPLQKIFNSRAKFELYSDELSTLYRIDSYLSAIDGKSHYKIKFPNPPKKTKYNYNSDLPPILIIDEENRNSVKNQELFNECINSLKLFLINNVFNKNISKDLRSCYLSLIKRIWSNAKIKKTIDEYKSKDDLEAAELDLKNADGFNDYFSFLIFLYLIRNIAKNEKLFIQKDEKPKEIDETLFNLTKLNALSYAEGLWQIIENAIIHSKGKTAYFGVRIYKADTSSPMNRIQKETTTRDSLWKKYWITDNRGHKSKNTAVNTNQLNNIFNIRDQDNNKIYTDFIEFYVLDCAVADNESVGILEKAKANYNFKKQFESLEELIELKEDAFVDNSTKEERKNYYTKHYGLQWLCKHVENLNGIMKVFSPYKSDKGISNYIKKRCYSNCFDEEFHGKKFIQTYLGYNGDDYLEKLENLYFTEYSILVPLCYSNKDDEINYSQKKSSPNDYSTEYNFFSEINDYSEILEVDLKIIDSYFKELNEQPNIKEDIKKKLINKFDSLLKDNQQDDSSPRKSVEYIKNSDYFLWKILLKDTAEPSNKGLFIECFAKALFNFIFDFHKYDQKTDVDKATKPEMYFAIAFPDDASISEFIRLFAVFYEKLVISDKEYMRNVQIAVCSQNEEEFKEVNFILAGKNFATAYNTANNYVYYNADSLNYIKLLNFLNPTLQNNDNDEKAPEQADTIKLFPFNIFI